MNESTIEYQRRRYDDEAAAYSAHHGDAYSQLYRDRFIRKELFAFDLSGKTVLDAMSASGTETGFLIARGADVLGLDISDNNAKLYRELWGRECLVRSIHDTGLGSESMDVVYVCGGLHHVLPILDETMAEVHRILKPGGYFCFVEPNRDTWLNKLRQLWYRLDKRFHETEEALSYERDLRRYLSLGFEEVFVTHGGNVAYVLVSQSLILGIPRWLKRVIFRPVFAIERGLRRVPGIPKLFIAAAWKKAGTAG